MKIKELLEEYGEIEIDAEKEKELKKLLGIQESKKWKPKMNEQYYCIAGCGDIDVAINVNHISDKGYMSMRNRFKTKEEAEFRLEQIKVYNELKAFADEHNDTIDWGNSNQMKYFICYGNSNKRLFSKYVNYHRMMLSVIYFTSKELLEDSIDKVGEERIKKYLFGVEDE